VILIYGVTLFWAWSVTGIAVAGFAMVLKGPSRRGVALAGLGMAAFILYCSQLGLSMLGTGVNFLHHVSGMILTNVALVCWIGGFYCSLLLLRAVCQALGKDGLAQSLMAHLITWASSHALALLMFLAMFALVGTAIFNFAPGVGQGAGPPPGAMSDTLQGVTMIVGLLMCLVLVAWLGLFIWYLVILFQVRDALESFLRRRR
jgi:hypothetical protein